MNNTSLIKSNIVFFFLILSLILILTGKASASDSTATSCSASDIQSAVENVISTGGGTVHIPACQADNTWKNGDEVIVETDVTYRIKGAGKNATVI